MTQLTTTNRQGFAPATITEAIQFSEMLASSQMVPKQYQGKPQDIMVCVQWGYEIGLAPMQALQNIAVINGKPSVYGDAAMALVQASPVCEDIEEFMEGEGTPNPVAVCVAKRKGRKPVVAKFSVEDAKRAGLWGKQGPWQAYPKRMMQMRARGFALRDAFPDVLKGLITAEEAQDYPTEEKSAPAPRKAPANPLDMVAPISAPISAPTLEASQTPNVVEIELPAADVVEAVPVAEATDAVAVEQQGSPDEPDAEDPDVLAARQAGERLAEELADLGAEVVAVGYPLKVPGKDMAHSIHQTLDEWQDAYEEMADKIAKAGKRPPRERMTILREFKEANQATMDRVDMVKRIRHTAGYSQRLKALGASQ